MFSGRIPRSRFDAQSRSLRNSGECMRRPCPKFTAFSQLDEEVAALLSERAERRRKLLTAIVGRMTSVHSPADLVDVLYALTSAEFYRLLAIHGRGLKAIEELIWQAVADAVNRFTVTPTRRRRANIIPAALASNSPSVPGSGTL